MLLQNVLFALVFSGLGLAQDIDDDGVPSQCRSVCSSVVSLTETCDRQNGDDDRGFINCVCSANNANVQIPFCEACVAQFDPNDGHDNDMNDLARSCSFSTTSYNPSATAPLPSGGMTQISGTNIATITSVPSGIASTNARLASSLSSILASAGTATITNGGSPSTGSTAQQSTGAAHMLEAPGAGAAGVGLGFLGAVVGML
ncbi:hypothetical protein BCR34DRAFT_597955 [Clohesyomyces aquaticus]|uniref:Extracellular membrane protein CFEM domain-containing protein n=1 Tax=Clohesyomyces aquaticus TaxID=1231657 RepID=A0A1Y2A0X5_9PLEO|nr:hypothetical protein BCR34DRAFT_597955 [Clohesyomyces aquaticus]